METVSLTFRDLDYRDTLLDELRNNVFHVTTRDAFNSIVKDSFVFHNRDDKLPINASSENSFGRSKGFVCLFDLRNANQEIIEDTLLKYYFLGPSWFTAYKGNVMEQKLSYLILDSMYYDKLIPNSFAKDEWKRTKKYKHYVPYTECWFPSDLPLKYFKKALHVDIYKDASPGSNEYLAYRLEQALKKGQPKK